MDTEMKKILLECDKVLEMIDTSNPSKYKVSLVEEILQRNNSIIEEINHIQLQHTSTSNGEKKEIHENDKRAAVLLIELNSNLNEIVRIYNELEKPSIPS